MKILREKFIYYSHYKYYNDYNMENTTIAISNEVRDKIKEFGNKGETYSEIIARLLESARKRMLHDLLMNEEGTVTIEEARKEVEKRWPRSK